MDPPQQAVGTWDPPEEESRASSNSSRLKHSLQSIIFGASNAKNNRLVTRGSGSGSSSNSSTRFRATSAIVLSIIAIVFMVWMKLFDGIITFSDVDPVQHKSKKLYGSYQGSSSTLQSGSSGSRFSGENIRTFGEVNNKKKISWATKENNGDGSTKKEKYKLSSPNQKILQEGYCQQWAVVTTIHPPNESIIGVSNLKRWCLVIVGDTISPNESYSLLATKDNVVYLSSDYQKEHYVGKGLPFVDLLPFKSFARKNIGYLFAISHGAKVIYDFDDDNVLLALEDGETVPPPFHLFGSEDRVNVESKRTILLRFAAGSGRNVGTSRDPRNATTVRRDLAEKDEYCSRSFNPYTFMKPTLLNSWPRGFPIDCLSHHFARASEIKIEVGDLNILSGVGVLQSLCDGAPDNDAIFRMTRAEATHFTFDRSITSLPLAIPSDAYSPYNAQATTHFQKAFWGLYLPITVPGRVTDIWRAYITQRLFRDVGLHVLYTPPIVKHERSDHDYLSDFVAEAALYEKTSKLLEYLDTWTSNAPYLPERIYDLWIGLYDRTYIEKEDVVAMKEWLDMLVLIGYEFPEIIEPLEFVGPQFQPNVQGQPYRALPYFDNAATREKVTSLSKSNPGQSLPGMGYIQRPPNAVLKYVMMTMNEWPLVKSWVLYHGLVIGFSNLYILDSSTDQRCLSFLRYARDALGVNVIFSDINLNEIAGVMTEMYRNMSGSSDFLIKGDTDEFLFVYDEKSKTFTSSVAEYLAGFEDNESHPLRLLDEDGKIGYRQDTLPDKDICAKDSNSPPETFPLRNILPASGYKAVTLSNKPYDKIVARLGGHVDESLEPKTTNFGIVHAHARCIEIEVENCKRVVERHGFIATDDTKEDALSKMLEKSDCKLDEDKTNDFCKTCDWNTFRGVSSHKLRCYAKWLACEDQMREGYYQIGPNVVALENEDWTDTLHKAIEDYDV